MQERLWIMDSQDNTETVEIHVPEAVPNEEQSIAESIGALAGKAVGTAFRAAKNAAEAIENAKQIVDEAIDEMQQAPIEEYKPMLEKVRKDLEGTSALSVLESLSESPVPLTEGIAQKAKGSFPIPKEQTVVWADAEFDLRPSGIVATDRGVFIKTDSRVFSFFGGLQDESEGEDAQNPYRSSLHYFPWEYFEPSWFAADSAKENLALRVAPECSKSFVGFCRMEKASQDAKRAERAHRLFGGLEGKEVEGKAAIVAAADVLSSEEASFVQQKAFVNDMTGHGEMAEYANHRIDMALGHKVEWTGPKNERNGADRVVDGVLVQTKYFKSARGSLEACFDPSSGLYRYMTESGEPMQLEVPKDQYDRVLAGFEQKIEQGKVPGVTDPAEAGSIVRKGRLTYEQAVNLTKPGTIESLAYDAATGAVICSCALGLSFLAASFMAYRKNQDMEEAMQAGISAGVQVFGISFIQHIVVSQLSRTSLAGALMAPSKVLTEQVLGYKASAVIVNGLRALMGKGAIGGAAATKQLAKMLRSNVVTAAATFVVFAVPDTYRLASRKTSAAQYAQNIVSLAASIAGSAGGAVVAGTATAKVAGAVGTTVLPGVGTAIGIAGGFAGGVAAAAASNAVGGLLYEGDSATFGRLFNAYVSAMSVEYLLDEGEIDQLVEALDGIEQKEFKKLMDDTFSADEQEKAIRAFLAPMIDEIVAKREKFAIPSGDKVIDVLEELADATEAEGEEI